MTDKIKLVASLSRDQLPAESGGTIYLLLQLVAPERKAEGRLPLNLSAVLDRSGSMSGPKLDYTKKAVGFLVDQTESADFLSILTYDDHVEVVQAASHIVNKDLLKSQVLGIGTGGMTNLSGGLAAGVREARKNAGSGLVNRVLLMTDGLANRGITNPAALVQKARNIRESGLLLTTIGVGNDFDEDLLTAMAEAGGGNFYYIENPDKIPAIFNQELQGLLTVAGQSLRVRVKAGEGVSIEGIIGYLPSGTPAEVTMNLPDIYSGETKSIVFELRVRPGAQGSRKLADIELEYENLLGDQGEVRILSEVPVSMVSVDEAEEVRENPTVLKEVYMARSGQALEEAIQQADRQDYGASSQVLEEAISFLEPMADDLVVAEQVRFLREKADQLKGANYDASTRKHMRTMNFQSRSGRKQN